MPENRNVGVYVKLTLVAMLWGGTIVAGRFSAEALPPVAASWMRYFAAVLLLVPILLRREGLPRLDRNRFFWTFALGLAGVVCFNLFFFLALRDIPASRGSVIMALSPVFMVIALVLFFADRPRPLRLAGVIVALAGAWTVLSHGDIASIFTNISAGDLYMLGASVSWTLYGLIARFGIRGLTPLAATTYASVSGLAVLTVFALPDLLAADWRAVSPAALAAMAYMGAGGTALAFIWYTEGLIRLGPARGTVFMNLVPVFSVALAAILLGESLAASMLIGGLITIAGVVMTNKG